MTETQTGVQFRRPEQGQNLVGPKGCRISLFRSAAEIESRNPTHIVDFFRLRGFDPWKRAYEEARRRFVNSRSRILTVMNTPVTQNSDDRSGTEGQFVAEADWIPSFWNFLIGLDRDDLIPELVQNDLDQGATHTVISFEQDRLVCEGNGKPVDDDGWERLRKMQGAGDTVRAKRGKIGVKNHGLKTVFTIGYEVRLMSAGQAIVQTLYAKGRNKPYPGASPRPIDDPQAPAEGCRVIIHYRDADIKLPHGEANVLGMLRAEEIDKLFEKACKSIPEQFAGIVSPEIVPSYEITLRHWRIGEACFNFSCTRSRKIAKAKGIEIFRRRCKISGTAFTTLPKETQEQAARRLVPLNNQLEKRIADFYRRKKRFYVEVSWKIDKSSKPQVSDGRFRYPIGYPLNSQEAYTGHSTYFNAPIASDSERHGPAKNEKTNEELRKECEALLLDVLVHHTIPRWGPDGLKPLVPQDRSSDYCNEAIRPLLAKLVEQGAIPVLSWHKALELSFGRGKRQIKANVRRIKNQGISMEKKRYGFIIPSVTWELGKIHPALSILCPHFELQLNPRIHADIISFLKDGKTLGFKENFITFDENDVFARVTGDGNEWFGPVVDREQEFSKPFIARSYLDLIKLALDEKEKEQME